MASAESKKLSLRVKSKKSQNAVLRDVDPQSPIQALLEKLSDLTGIPAEKIGLLKGFPPKRVEFASVDLVNSLGLQNQDTIIVEEGSSGSHSNDDNPGSAGAEVIVREAEAAINYEDLIPQNASDGLLLRHIVASDNSCLFSSVLFCLADKLERQGQGQLTPTYLRDVIANAVSSDPIEYTEAILGRPNKDYVNWIKLPESWGGGIELAVLSSHFGVQIGVVDTQSLHISYFGEDKNFSEMMFIIYDGIHYDPLYYEVFNGRKGQTIFETTNTRVVELAKQLGKEAQASSQFTDLKNFSLRCQMCNTLLKGQEEAQAHAKKTGHAAFAEIKKS